MHLCNESGVTNRVNMYECTWKRQFRQPSINTEGTKSVESGRTTKEWNAAETRNGKHGKQRGTGNGKQDSKFGNESRGSETWDGKQKEREESRGKLGIESREGNLG